MNALASDPPSTSVRPGTLRASVALVVALAPLAIAPDLVTGGSSLAPLAQLPRTDWVLFVLLLFASAPRATGADATALPFLPTVSLVLLAPLALVALGTVGAAADDLLRPALALVLAAACERAARRTAPGTWSLVWWGLFAAPVAVGVSFGWAVARDAPVLVVSPLALSIEDAWTGTWIGATLGLAAALLAPVLRPARNAAAAETSA